MIQRGVAEAAHDDGVARPGALDAELPGAVDRDGHPDRSRQVRGDRRGLRDHGQIVVAEHLVPAAGDRLVARGGDAEQHVRNAVAARLRGPGEVEGSRAVVEQRRVGRAQRERDDGVALVPRRADRVEAAAFPLQPAGREVAVAARDLGAPERLGLGRRRPLGARPARAPPIAARRCCSRGSRSSGIDRRCGSASAEEGERAHDVRVDRFLPDDRAAGFDLAVQPGRERIGILAGVGSDDQVLPVADRAVALGLELRGELDRLVARAARDAYLPGCVPLRRRPLPPRSRRQARCPTAPRRRASARRRSSSRRSRGARAPRGSPSAPARPASANRRRRRGSRRRRRPRGGRPAGPAPDRRPAGSGPPRGTA